MEEDACEDDVAIDFGVEGEGGFGEIEEIEGVFKESAEEGVVEGLSGGRLLKFVHEVGVVEVFIEEGADGGGVDGFEDAIELGEHGGDVAGGGGEEVDQLFGGGSVGGDVLNDELHFALIGLGLAFEDDEAIGGKFLDEFFGSVPHAAGGAAGAVCDEALEVGFAVSGEAELCVLDGVDAFDELVGCEVGDVGSLGHGGGGLFEGLWRPSYTGMGVMASFSCRVMRGAWVFEKG